MGKVLYLECSSGISGDMAVAALLDVGASEEYLQEVLRTLPVDGFEVQVSRVKKSGLDACDFKVVLDDCAADYDHDMDYLYGELPDICKHEHEHEHDHEPNHKHGHEHEHSSANKSSIHRNPQDIAAIIDATDMTARAKLLAHRIFDILAQAEAQAHGVSLDQVHFHEVGALDSIVDVISFAVCFDNLDIDEVVLTELCEGQGTVRCQHGILPVPVPAVTNIVCQYALPLKIINVRGELVTPTGAAIAAAIRTQKSLPDCFVIERVGLGAGKRDYPTAGIVRALLLSEQQ